MGGNPGDVPLKGQATAAGSWHDCRMEEQDGPKKKITAKEARELTKNVYMDREATAEYLGISPRLLANHTHDGPAFHKFFGKVLYNLADVENWAKQQKVDRRPQRYSWQR